MKNLIIIFSRHSILFLTIFLSINFLIFKFYKLNFINLKGLSLGVLFFFLFLCSIVLLGRSICFKDAYRSISALIGFNLKIALLVSLFFLIPGKDKLFVFSFCAPLIVVFSSFLSFYFQKPKNHLTPSNVL